jgi:hypothetical protein
MSTTAHSTAPSGPRPRPPALLVAFMIAIASLGGVGFFLAAGIFDRGAGPGIPPPRPHPRPYSVGDAVPTTFGAVAVEHVERLKGLTAKDLSGVTHGIQNLIGPDRIQIQTSVTLTNLSTAVQPYSPAEFALVETKGAKPPPAGRRGRLPFSASVHDGTLQPDASIGARITFTSQRNGDHLWMRYTDPGRRSPVLIDLGRVAKLRSNVLQQQLRYFHHH